MRINLNKATTQDKVISLCDLHNMSPTQLIIALIDELHHKDIEHNNGIAQNKDASLYDGQRTRNQTLL